MAQPGNAFRVVAVNPVTQGLAVHPGQPRCARPIHTFQSLSDGDQPSADATLARPPRSTAQFLRTNVILDRQSTLWVPPPRPQHPLLSTRFSCNSLGES